MRANVVYTCVCIYVYVVYIVSYECKRDKKSTPRLHHDYLGIVPSSLTDPLVDFSPAARKLVPSLSRLLSFLGDGVASISVRSFFIISLTSDEAITSRSVTDELHVDYRISFSPPLSFSFSPDSSEPRMREREKDVIAERKNRQIFIRALTSFIGKLALYHEREWERSANVALIYNLRD